MDILTTGKGRSGGQTLYRGSRATLMHEEAKTPAIKIETDEEIRVGSQRPVGMCRFQRYRRWTRLTQARSEYEEHLRTERHQI